MAALATKEAWEAPSPRARLAELSQNANPPVEEFKPRKTVGMEAAETSLSRVFTENMGSAFADFDRPSGEERQANKARIQFIEAALPGITLYRRKVCPGDSTAGTRIKGGRTCTLTNPEDPLLRHAIVVTDEPLLEAYLEVSIDVINEQEMKQLGILRGDLAVGVGIGMSPDPPSVWMASGP